MGLDAWKTKLKSLRYHWRDEPDQSFHAQHTEQTPISIEQLTSNEPLPRSSRPAEENDTTAPQRSHAHANGYSANHDVEEPSLAQSSGDTDHSEDEFSSLGSDEDRDMFDMFTGQSRTVGSVGEVHDWDVMVPIQQGFDASVQSSRVNSPRVLPAAQSTSEEIPAWHDLLETPAWHDLLDEPQEFLHAKLRFDAIRKLDIARAASPDEGLRVNLLQGTTDQSDYIALSYAWGATFEDGSHLTHTITLDGRSFRVTQSLHDALLAIRRQLDMGQWHDFGKRPYVWADAICIDQHAVDERNDQVQRMDKIYQQARRVIVHLGHAQDINCTRLIRSARDLLASTSEARIEPQLYVELRSLLLRPWFSRRWVIQEFALNSRRTILLGDEAIDGQYVTTILTHCYKRATGDMHPSMIDYGYGGPILNSTSVFDSTSPRRWLPTNLFFFRRAKCSDPRDQVYSLLSLSCGCRAAQSGSQHGGSSCTSRVAVDYSLSLDDLLFNLAQDWVKHDIMAVLALASVPNQTQTMMSKVSSQRRNPSWVPSPSDSIFVASKYIWDEMQEFWLAIEDCFQPSLPGKVFDHGFTMLEDSKHWFVRKDFPAPCVPPTIPNEVEEELVPSRFPLTLSNYKIEFSSKHREWFYQERIPARMKADNSKILIVNGWLLQQPSEGTTLPHQIAWKTYPRSFKSFMHWNPRASCGCQPNNDPYQVSSSSWPVLLPDQAVFLVFRYKLALILQKTQHENQYHFIRCVVRSDAINNLRFAWVQKETGHVWAYGSIEEHPVEIEII